MYCLLIDLSLFLILVGGISSSILLIILGVLKLCKRVGL